MEPIYEYLSSWFHDGRAERVVCQGRASFVEEFISRDEFPALFGGYALSEDRRGQDYLGVWGSRICKRFRRVLRERGASFQVSSDAPKLRLKVRTP
jgi:hypothetical protein